MSTRVLKDDLISNAPFIHSVWNNPKVLEILSKLAGIELVPIFEYETGHTNVSIDDCKSVVKTGSEEDEAAFSWHYDSVPFVCVTMLSDCTGMVGGETAVRLGEDQVMKVRGPTQVRIICIPTFPSHSS